MALDRKSVEIFVIFKRQLLRVFFFYTPVDSSLSGLFTQIPYAIMTNHKKIIKFRAIVVARKAKILFFYPSE